MLVIRQEQIQHFIAADENQLVEVIAQSMRKTNPERVSDFDDKTLQEMVKVGIERAKSHGLERAEEIAAFVGVMFEIAPNFDEQEEIKKVFDDTNFPAPARFEQLWDRVSPEAWEKAEQEYNLNVWFPITSDK